MDHLRFRELAWFANILNNQNQQKHEKEVKRIGTIELMGITIGYGNTTRNVYITFNIFEINHAKMFGLFLFVFVLVKHLCQDMTSSTLT